MWPHTVAILIGGKSSRMGSPKHKVTFQNGKTMLDVMLEFASSTAKRTVIVGGIINTHHCISDHRPGLGPVAGIEALLTSNIDERYLVVGCDMPLLKTETVQPLFVDGEAVLYKAKIEEDYPSPLPLVIHAHCKDACSTYLDQGKRSLHGFLQELDCTFIQKPRGIEPQLTSINTPDQLHNCTFE